LEVDLISKCREHSSWICIHTNGIHRMNLMGLTSSRSDDRTKAYTERILSVEGNVFSSCVRSVNLTRMVVYTKLWVFMTQTLNGKGDVHLAIYSALISQQLHAESGAEGGRSKVLGCEQ
jgi:hypothetical protein